VEEDEEEVFRGAKRGSNRPDHPFTLAPAPAHARNESTIPNYHFLCSGHLIGSLFLQLSPSSPSRKRNKQKNQKIVYQKTLIKLLTLERESRGDERDVATWRSLGLDG
jgi:hypothetical protein